MSAFLSWCRSGRVWVLTLQLGLPVSVPVTVSAQDDSVTGEGREDARRLFELGRQRFESEQYEAALEAFQEAYGLEPHPSVKLNMAACYEKLGQPVRALVHYEDFLKTATSVSKEREAAVFGSMATLRKRVGELEVIVSPDGAKVTVDGDEVRRTPLASPLRLSSGMHSFVVEKHGYETHREDKLVWGGSRALLRVTLVPARESPTPAVAPSPKRGSGQGGEQRASAPSERKTDVNGAAAVAPAEKKPDGDGSAGEPLLSVPVILSAGVTGAFLVGALVTGVLALQADSEFDEAVRDTNNDSLSRGEREAAFQDGRSASDRAEGFALATDLLLVGAGVGAVTTVVLYLVHAHGSDDGDADRGRSGNVEFSLTPTVTGTNGGGLLGTLKF